MSEEKRQEQTLRGAIDSAQPLYVLPDDPFADDLLIPALSASTSLDIMMGYFSSNSFSEIASGLATFLRNTSGPMRMVISPFLTDRDFEILTKNETELRELSEKIIFDELPDEHQLAIHTLECLAWLITQGRLSIQVAIMREAIFHTKAWLFSDGINRAAIHGSTNFTKKGLSRNKEQLTVSRGWKNDEAIYQIDRLQKEFDNLWSGGDENCHVMRLPDAVEKRIVERYKKELLPNENTARFFWQKTRQLSESIEISSLTQISELKIPTSLIYDQGNFAHQGRAVECWIGSGYKGILEMATGAGKTITAMICATKLQNQIGKILVVVAAPYRPLIEQWYGEILEFGVRPINLILAGGPEKRAAEISQAGRRLRIGGSKVEILIVSNNTLCTRAFINSISKVDIPKLIVADECHNLGAESFVKSPPEIFDFRLGLSATPIRQYDEEGTDEVVRFFGEICFSFTLKEAIGICLTEYDYFVHFVELTDLEMEKWRDLTEEISAQSWRFQSRKNDPLLDNLLRQRRLVIETATGKLNHLEKLFNEINTRELHYALIYATDKDPEQLQLVNDTLRHRNVLFHQLTADETKNRAETGRILSAFENGDLQVLTAKRVLDEGVNIPQTKLAFILASTTVKRQWIQRRGRLLRKCDAINKTHAKIHDFVVLTPGAESGIDELDPDARKLVRSELERVWEFARLSRNGPMDGGPYEAVRYLQELANERVMD